MTQRAARPLPRVALLLLCAAYVLPGVFGRDPWRQEDITAFGYMLSLAEGRSDWLAPSLGGIPAHAALLPHWLGAAFIKLLSPAIDPSVAARLPFAALLGLVLALTWYTTFQLARTEAAQPVALAFGGEASTVDYARAIADAAVLALIASLGLLQLGHETTPELAQLFGVSLYLWALAAAPYRTWQVRLAALAALVVVSGSNAPAMALAMGLAGMLVFAFSGYEQVRAQVSWLALATLAGAAVAWWLGAWAWRVDVSFDLPQLLQIGRMWLWFMWPAWVLALWTLWRWRKYLQNRHVSVPLLTVLVALGASIVMGSSERALLLGLPGLAVLAAFALPTLNRSTTAAIDWFSMILFTAGAIAIWVIYLSVQTGVPAKPAANIQRLGPGFRAGLLGRRAGLRAGGHGLLAVAAALAHRAPPPGPVEEPGAARVGRGLVLDAADDAGPADARLRAQQPCAGRAHRRARAGRRVHRGAAAGALADRRAGVPRRLRGRCRQRCAAHALPLPVAGGDAGP